MKLRTLIGLAVLGVSVQANAAFCEAAGTILAYSGGEGGVFAAPPGATLEVRRYRRTPPPPPRERRDRGTEGWLQVRGGFFDSDQVSKDDWTLGLKAVANVAPTMRLGGTLDLVRRTNSQRTIITEYVDGLGNTVRQEATTGEAESNLVPLLAVAEIVFPAPGIQPYVGIGGGWEFLNVQAVDFATNYAYEADYDGPGWQAYVGADFAVAPRMRLNAELFHNGAIVERRVVDPFVGVAYDERIDVGGNGGRVGLSFAF